MRQGRAPKTAAVTNLAVVRNASGQRVQTEMKIKRLLAIGLTIIVLETLIFWLLIYQGKPDPSVSIGLILFVPNIFIVNILVGLALYFNKQKQTGYLMLINSIISPSIFYLLWTLWFEGWSERNYTEFAFELEGKKFEVSLSKTSNYFTISDITNQSNGTTTGLFFGDYQVNGDTIILIDGQVRMRIADGKLFDFRPNTVIGLEKLTDH